METLATYLNSQAGLTICSMANMLVNGKVPSYSSLVKYIPFDIDDLIKAFKKCKNNVLWKDSVASYNRTRALNAIKTMKALKNGNYKLRKYTKFIVYEPKRREIVATSIYDRVVQRAICDNYLYKEITKSFIYDNMACQVNKGTDLARRRLKYMLQRAFRKNGLNSFVLKLDIKSFFAETNHLKLKELICKKIKNPWIVLYICYLIDSFEGEKGIGLGSQISQLLQLFILDELDHYIKEKLHIRNYIRYMDDIIIVGVIKEKAKECVKYIENYISKFGLIISKNKTYIASIKQNIKFLGYSYKINSSGFVIRKLLRKAIIRQKRRIRKYMELFQFNIMKKENIYQSLNGVFANAIFGNNYKIIRLIKSDFNQLINRLHLRLCNLSYF